MFKRLAPVIELSESCSESSSPAHKRSQTQHRTRFMPSPSNSNTQVWQIIQSRRNLDKKMRLVKSRVVNSVDKPRGKVESPCNRSFLDGLSEKKSGLQIRNKVHVDKNKENKERIVKRAEKARMEVKLQYAIDLEFIKKRNELIFIQKREKVNSIRSGFVAGKHKRGGSGKVLREVCSSELLNRTLKVESSKGIAGKKENCRSVSAFCGGEKKRSNKALSALISPRYRVSREIL